MTSIPCIHPHIYTRTRKCRSPHRFSTNILEFLSIWQVASVYRHIKCFPKFNKVTLEFTILGDDTILLWASFPMFWRNQQSNSIFRVKVHEMIISVKCVHIRPQKGVTTQKWKYKSQLTTAKVWTHKREMACPIIRTGYTKIPRMTNVWGCSLQIAVCYNNTHMYMNNVKVYTRVTTSCPCA
jgi:hypothetical protein